MKQVRDLRIGDIDRRGEDYILCTTTLAGENFRCNIYGALDEVNVRGTQEALF